MPRCCGPCSGRWKKRPGKILFHQNSKDKDGNDMMQQIQRNSTTRSSRTHRPSSTKRWTVSKRSGLYKRLGLDNEKHPRRVILPLIKYQDEVCVGDFPINFPPYYQVGLCNRGIPFHPFPELRQSPSFPHVLFTFSARADPMWLKQHWINSIQWTSYCLFSVSFFIVLRKLQFPFIFSFPLAVLRFLFKHP